MERDSVNDVYRHMANYSFKKPINVTYIFEDPELDVLNSQPTEKQVQNASQSSNTKSATKLLTTPLTNQHCYNNVITDEARNVEQEEQFYSEDTRQIDTHTGSKNYKANSISNSTNKISKHHYAKNDPIQMSNITNRTPNHNFKTSNEINYMNLLNTLSTNLMSITMCYHRYNLQYAKNHSVSEKYIQSRKHYFEQSYNAIVSILLPQEHNKAFIRSFINRTIETARRKSWYHHMTVEELELLVNGMIQWAKNKKSYHEGIDNELQNPMRRPRPGSLVPPSLPLPSVPPPPYSDLHFNARVPPSLPLPSVPPPPYNVPFETYVLPAPPSSNKVPPVSPVPPSSNNVPPVSPVLPSSNTISDVNTRQTIYKSPIVTPILPSPPISYNNTNTSHHHQNERVPTEDHQENIHLFSAGPPGSEISIDPVVTKRVKKSSNTQTSKIRKTDDKFKNRTLSSSCTRIPQMQNQGNTHGQRNLYQVPLTTNTNSINSVQPEQNVKEFENTDCQPQFSRSVSRDSGFGSPVLCSILLNNDCNTTSAQNQEFTPEIVHVTSLHPNALYIIDGPCKICGTSTKNVCIVCYNEYYCGSVCQSIDWPQHQLKCRAR